MDLLNSIWGLCQPEQHWVASKILELGVGKCNHAFTSEIRNIDLCRDLEMKYIYTEIRRYGCMHEESLHLHDKIEAIQLLADTDMVRRLKQR